MELSESLSDTDLASSIPNYTSSDDNSTSSDENSSSGDENATSSDTDIDVSCLIEKSSGDDSNSEKHYEDLLQEIVNNFDRDGLSQRSRFLKSHRQELLQGFQGYIMSSHNVPPIANEIDCCAFCLCRKNCKIIYPEKEISADVCGHLPLLSVILPMSQYELYILLQYLLKWYKTRGPIKRLTIWMFSCLMCLENPVCYDTEDLLKEIFDFLKIQMFSESFEDKVRAMFLMRTMKSLFSLSIQDDVEKLKKYKELCDRLNYASSDNETNPGVLEGCAKHVIYKAPKIKDTDMWFPEVLEQFQELNFNGDYVATFFAEVKKMNEEDLFGRRPIF